MALALPKMTMPREQRILALAIFRSVYGHCRPRIQYVVPAAEPWPELFHGLALGRLADNARSSCKMLEPENFAQLEAIGFAWALHLNNHRIIVSINGRRNLQRVQLSALVAALQTYSDRFGDLDMPNDFVVPHDDDAWPAEAAHVVLRFAPQALRTNFYALSDDDVASVHGLSLCKDLLPWTDVLRLLSLYKINTGCNFVPLDFVVPSTDAWPACYFGATLGDVVWYLGIKRALLPPKRRAELADTAIAFNVPATWARIVRGLEIYVAHVGHAIVPSSFVIPDEWGPQLCGMRLGHFVAKLRQASALWLLPKETMDSVAAIDALVASGARTPWPTTQAVSATAVVRTPGPLAVGTEGFAPMTTSDRPMDVPCHRPRVEHAYPPTETISYYALSPSIGSQCMAASDVSRPSKRPRMDADGSPSTSFLQHVSDASAMASDDGQTEDAPEIEPETSDVIDSAPRRKWSFQEKLTALGCYRAEHGHLAVPQAFRVPPTAAYPAYLHGMLLGIIVSALRQKDAMLSPDQQSDLDTLGFLWRVRGSVGRCIIQCPNTSARAARTISWHDQIQALLVFQQQHGHFHVPRGFVVPADDAWPLSTHHLLLEHVPPAIQAHLYELSDDQANVVRSAGLVPSVPDFRTFVCLLGLFQTTYGVSSVYRDFVIPATGGSWLDAWRGLDLGELAWRVGLNMSLLSKEKQAALAGIVFNSDATWARILRGLEHFERLYGPLSAPSSFVVPSTWPSDLVGLRLGHWSKVTQVAFRLELLPPTTAAAVKKLVMQSVPVPLEWTTPTNAADASALQTRVLAMKKVVDDVFGLSVPETFVVPANGDAWPEGSHRFPLGEGLRWLQTLPASPPRAIDQADTRASLQHAPHGPTPGRDTPMPAAARMEQTPPPIDSMPPMEELEPSSVQEPSDASPSAMDLQRQVHVIALYRAMYGSADIPIEFLVPASEPWPVEYRGLRLGAIANEIQRVKRPYDRGFERDLRAVGFVWHTAAPSSRCVVCEASGDLVVETIDLSIQIRALVAYWGLGGDLDAIPVDFSVPVSDPMWPSAAAGIVLSHVPASLRYHWFELTPAMETTVRRLGLFAQIPPFDTFLSLVEMYRRTLGDASVPLDFAVPESPAWPAPWHGVLLGQLAWFIGLRASKLRPDQANALRTIGFTFGAPATWAHIVSGVGIYYRLHGASVVPPSFVVPATPEWPTDLYNNPLGYWVEHMAMAKRLRLLPRATLDALQAAADDAAAQGPVATTMYLACSRSSSMDTPSTPSGPFGMLPEHDRAWSPPTWSLALGHCVQRLKAAYETLPFSIRSHLDAIGVRPDDDQGPPANPMPMVDRWQSPSPPPR
ncbi:hypothetical protein SPRG_08901 [Saprolegnia parasitica CBS 223.65]|uniref:Helicase-associated domain-containing protein n=1 Tax=Saprolegnia parasitica (strain CBS 223.65) TaxID=695850 RepID=A0A067CFM0_SAPPC|nr:hypothetical protein SPRG_08901 [Saprolegnia parasitica CBS 223.65]KDO25602.1 hypothetical protein SPRG_08901 [Saprolegnia parasitica CBS 223.65]|eukprot:XP_012203636.1 hypothetical protein SPRG_08901 [Saprolegnia parasitica CBS 223.65]